MRVYCYFDLMCWIDSTSLWDLLYCGFVSRLTRNLKFTKESRIRLKVVDLEEDLKEPGSAGHTIDSGICDPISGSIREPLLFPIMQYLFIVMVLLLGAIFSLDFQGLL